ncbi:HXXXD-type acyl-transferase family protein [Striga hermonthica]|uniref:HXXXD-type acyl-transferase family protein n=1 Tax=Striga hermonthica TaxID=68872 RepID=A0A9N7R2K8_STRHE|nr:HXXXD-type acyl-transferase family protein [Striga hermonthica]
MEPHRVHIISREIIQPSSPNHLKNLELSYLDQLCPHLYFPLIFFYRAPDRVIPINGPFAQPDDHSRMSRHLKQSLSRALVSFFPLPGRILDDFTVKCNDTGVEFIDARAHSKLVEDIVRDPNDGVEELKAYLPVDPTIGGLDNGSALLLVQATFFDCGGVAVGMCFSHRVADCASMMCFLRLWTAECRGKISDEVVINFNLASCFPARDFSGLSLPRFPMSDDNFRTRRFVFDEGKLAALRRAAANSAIVDPTRVELVSAYIWKVLIETAKSKNVEKRKVFAAFHAVNVRARAGEPRLLLENVFGNCIMSAMATTTSCDEEFHDLVAILRSKIKKVNQDYIRKARDSDGYLNELFELIALLGKGELEYCRFSSWCQFPVYEEVDFGWGRPALVCTTSLPLKNVIVLVRSRCGEGIEAWVNMSKDNLGVLENKLSQLV